MEYEYWEKVFQKKKQKDLKCTFNQDKKTKNKLRIITLCQGEVRVYSQDLLPYLTLPNQPQKRSIDSKHDICKLIYRP